MGKKKKRGHTDLAKVGVEGSNPFARSNFSKVADRQFRPQGRRQAALLYGAAATIRSRLLF
jgi:hypothetical protein